MPSTRSATRGWFSIDSTMIVCHCSSVDSSMRVKVMTRIIALGARPVRRPAGRGRRRPTRHGPPAAGSVLGEPGRPDKKPSVAPTARSSSRSSGGGGKYSSSVVTVTSVTPSARREAGDHGLDERLGRRGTRRDADRAGQVVGELVGLVDPQDPRAAAGTGDLLQGDGVGGVGRADHDDGVGLGGDRLQGRLAVGGGEAEVAAVGHPEIGEAAAGRLHQAAPLVVAERRLGEEGDRGAIGVEVVERLEVGLVLDEAHRLAARPPWCRRPPRGRRGRRRARCSPCGCAP